MWSKQMFIAAALVAATIAPAAPAPAAQRTAPVAPVFDVSFSTSVAAARACDVADAWSPLVQTDANAARGAGFLTWWRGHGKQIAEAVGCAVDGAAIGRMLAIGMAAAGGPWAAAGLAAAALACLG